jgi:Helix-turn-helix domain
VARPEKQVDPSAGPLAEFALGLRELRQRAGGVSYRQLHEIAHCSPSALSEAAGGHRLPTWTVTKAYVEACGGDVAEWQDRWQHTRASLSRPRSVAKWQELLYRRAQDLAADERMVVDPKSSTAQASGDSTVPLRPDPRLIHTTPQLVEGMNRLRVWHGKPSLRKLAADSRHAFGSSTLADALHRREKLPSFTLLTAFVKACGEPSDLVEEWKNAWRRIELRESKTTICLS